MQALNKLPLLTATFKPSPTASCPAFRKVALSSSRVRKPVLSTVASRPDPPASVPVVSVRLRVASPASMMARTAFVPALSKLAPVAVTTTLEPASCERTVSPKSAVPPGTVLPTGVPFIVRLTVLPDAAFTSTPLEPAAVTPLSRNVEPFVSIRLARLLFAAFRKKPLPPELLPVVLSNTRSTRELSNSPCTAFRALLSSVSSTNITFSRELPARLKNRPSRPLFEPLVGSTSRLMVDPPTAST